MATVTFARDLKAQEREALEEGRITDGTTERAYFVEDTAHVVASWTSDVLNFIGDPERLIFYFTTNTGATASTAWTLEASHDGSSDWKPINTGTLVGGAAAAITDIVGGYTKIGTVLYSVHHRYYRFSFVTSTATHTFGVYARARN